MLYYNLYILIYKFQYKPQRERKESMITSKKSGYRGSSRLKNVFRSVIVGTIMLLWFIGCSSGPAQSPEDLVRSFLGKHLLMTDLSLAQFYTVDEQPGIIEKITNTINAKKEGDNTDTISSVKYDFSQVAIKVIDNKTDYVDDEEVKFVKVAAKGNYSVTKGNKKMEKTENEIFVLRAAGNEWKVTEKLNPWN